MARNNKKLLWIIVKIFFRIPWNFSQMFFYIFWVLWEISEIENNRRKFEKWGEKYEGIEKKLCRINLEKL